MRRAWILGAVALALGVLSAAAVRPGRWSAGRLAARVAAQLATGQAAAVEAESSAGLRPYLGGGHLAAAAAPLGGARLAGVRVTLPARGEAVAAIRYTDGQRTLLRLDRAADGHWEVSGLG